MGIPEKVRPLIQELAQAIHESVEDSASIAEAMAAIRKAGYDVFLVLDATLGFNKREGAEPQVTFREPTPLVDTEGNVSPKAFTARDKRDLLRDLKIKLDPEDP